MICSDCGKDLIKFFVFSEKNEELYCIDCCYKHVGDDIIFYKCENNQWIPIKVGVGGAGMGYRHHKSYTDEDWVLGYPRCSHIEDFADFKKPIFFCEDGKIRCSDCLCDDKIELADPLMRNEKSDDEMGDIMWLLPGKYEPHNLEFSFGCDNKGIKGEYINVNVNIKNNKSHSIEDINLRIESFSADPLIGDRPYAMYYESNYYKTLIHEEFHFESLESDGELNFPLKIRIPKDGEIHKGQFCDYHSGETLLVPEDLMIFAEFDYRTCSGYKYLSNVLSKLVEVR